MTNFSTNAEPTTTARLRSRRRRSGIATSVFRSSRNSTRPAISEGSPDRGVSMCSSCAEPASSANSTIAPFELARMLRDEWSRRSGASAPPRTSAATVITASTSEKTEGGVHGRDAPGSKPPNNRIVRKSSGRTTASRAAVTCALSAPAAG